MSFAVRKFLPLLLTGVLSTSLWFVATTTTSVVAGNALGETALAGVSLVSPLFSALGFVAELVGFGTAIALSLEMGHARPRRANECFSLGFWTAVAVGGLVSLFLLFGARFYLSFFGAAPEVTAAASRYLAWYWPAPLLSALMTLGLYVLAAEGDTLRCTAATLAFFVLNAVFMLIGVRTGHGLGSCALATVLAEAVAVAILATHAFAKANTLRFVRHFAWKDLRDIFGRSFGDSVQSLSEAVLMLFLAKIVILKLGSGMLPVLQVALTLWGLSDFLDGIPGAIPPLVTVYHGEGNPAGVRRVMRAATRLSLAAGVVLALVLMAAPDLLPRLLGVTDPALRASSARMVRFVAPVLVALAFACLHTAYFACVERSRWALALSLTVYLAGPVLAILVCSAVAPDGLWFGLMAGPYLALAVVGAVLFRRAGRAGFPLLLDRSVEARTSCFTLLLADSEVVAVSRQIGEKLGRNASVALKASLLVEEALLAVRDRNAGRRVLAEVTLIDGPEALLILRDDGEIFDNTDADAKISSLRGFVVANLMERQLHRQNLITTGFNRNVFRFTT